MYHDEVILQLIRLIKLIHYTFSHSKWMRSNIYVIQIVDNLISIKSRVTNLLDYLRSVVTEH